MYSSAADVAFELWPRGVQGVQTQYNIDHVILSAAPLAATLPGRYGLHARLSPNRNKFVLDASARQVAINFHGSEDSMTTHISSKRAKGVNGAAHVRRAFSRNPTPAPILRITPPQGGYDFASNLDVRCQTVIRFPTLEVSTGHLEWGVGCQGCYGNHDRLLVGSDPYRLFTNDEFLRHFDQCESAQKKWQQYLISGGTMEETFWPGTNKRCHTIIRPK